VVWEVHQVHKCFGKIVYLCDSIFVVNSLRQTFQVTLVSESQDKNNHSAEAIELFSNGVGFKTWD
jgi:hypothetical protein